VTFNVTSLVPETLREYLLCGELILPEARELRAAFTPGFGATYGPGVLQLPQAGAPPPACAVTVNTVDPLVEPRVAWMVGVPAATPVAKPVELMVASDEFEEDQATEVVMS
jgi:hypothetical protein